MPTVKRYMAAHGSATAHSQCPLPAAAKARSLLPRPPGLSYRIPCRRVYFRNFVPFCDRTAAPVPQLCLILLHRLLNRVPVSNGVVTISTPYPFYFFNFTIYTSHLPLRFTQPQLRSLVISPTTDAYHTPCISPCPRGRHRDHRHMQPATRAVELRYRLRSRTSYEAGQDD